MTLVGLYVAGIVSKAKAELTTMSKGVHISSDDLPTEPANIPLFNRIVDNLKWKIGRASCRERVSSPV